MGINWPNTEDEEAWVTKCIVITTVTFFLFTSMVSILGIFSLRIIAHPGSPPPPTFYHHTGVILVGYPGIILILVLHPPPPQRSIIFIIIICNLDQESSPSHRSSITPLIHHTAHPSMESEYWINSIFMLNQNFWVQFENFIFFRKTLWTLWRNHHVQPTFRKKMRSGFILYILG